MKKLIYSQEDLDLILSLEIQEKEEQIDQLTNNWNELEEYIIKNKDYYGGITSEDILDKMKEIKEGNNVSSRD